MGNLSSSIVWMLGGMALASTVLLSACDSGTTSASNSTNVAKPVAPAELPPAIEKSRSEEHTSELQSLMRISYAVFCLKKKNKTKKYTQNSTKSKKQKMQNHETQ